jgi:hypothetical protein
VIDGEPLTDLVEAFEVEAGMERTGGKYGGLIPAFFRVFPLDAHFHGHSTMQPKTVLLACGCGEWGCWPLMASITVNAESVTWDAFEQPHRPGRDYSGFGSFRFARRQYDAAVDVLASWSPPT